MGSRCIVWDWEKAFMIEIEELTFRPSLFASKYVEIEYMVLLKMKIKVEFPKTTIK